MEAQCHPVLNLALDGGHLPSLYTGTH